MSDFGARTDVSYELTTYGYCYGRHLTKGVVILDCEHRAVQVPLTSKPKIPTSVGICHDVKGYELIKSEVGGLRERTFKNVRI